MPSTRGHFLLASSSLRDPNFEQGVVLMVKHDDDGAIGVIINHPIAPEVTVADALGDNFESAADIRSPLHKGGPCEGPMMILTSKPGPKSDEVIPGIFFTAASEDIEAVMSDAHEPSRYIIGYAGWSSDQLEGELSEGSWEILPATKEDVFGTTHDLWQRLMGRATLLKYMRPEDIPEDPEMN
jgi:putative transcriptional regulator